MWRTIVTQSVGENPSFDLVLLGTDLGVYAYARAFHARYGVRSTVIARVAAGPIRNSKIIDMVTIGEGAERPETLAALERIGREKKAQGRTTLLLSNGDTFSAMFSEQADWLRQWYVVPALDPDLLAATGDKIEFARLCTELGIPTPRIEIQDFSDADSPDWSPQPVDLEFPVVAKPAKGSAYEGLHFQGKQKIYKVDDLGQLHHIFGLIRAAGFRDRFVVQELIPGDDTAMRSVTAYVDQRGEVTLLASAHVLLQEHHPLMIGNPAAMVTTPFPEITAQAERFLRHVGYRGFANFDVKVDPRDGVAKFFEVNPRIGRNNFYVTAAGANVAEFIVADLIENRSHDKTVVSREVLYSVVPTWLVRRYLLPRELALMKRAARNGVFHPLDYRDSLWRKGYLQVSKLNYVRKYARDYPRRSEAGF